MNASRVLAGFVLVATATSCGRAPGDAAAADRAGYRRTHREYDGAPPVIPHAVASLGREDCLSCHQEGMSLESDELAPRAPHPERVQCRQCHVEQHPSQAGFVANTFSGLRNEVKGTRAYAGAPPTLPHPRNGREACLGCHGTNGGSPIRTPHADRVNCLQCHVEQQEAPPFGSGAPAGAQP